LFILLTFFGRAAWASPSWEVDTTSSPTNANAQDTVDFYVFDYSTATFVNTQPLPIDRPFNIKIINVPADTVMDSLYILRMEPRSHRKGYKFNKHGVLTQTEMDSLVVVVQIRCGASNTKTKATERIFIVPHILIPNRNYLLSFGGHYLTKISAAQQAAARGKLIPLLRADPYFKHIVRKDFNNQYLHPEQSMQPLQLSQDTLRTHLQRMVQQLYPQYTVRFPDGQADTVQYYYSFGDRVRELNLKLSSLQKCIGSSKKPPAKFTAVQTKLANDTTGSIDTVLTAVEDNLKGLKAELDDSCKDDDSLAIVAIDSANKLLDSTIYNATDSVLVSNSFSSSALSSTYYIDITKNAQRNVTLDVGGAYSWGMDQFVGYYAINIYFRPIDKNVPLWNTYYGWGDFLASHLSMVVGLTLTSVAQSKVRTGIVGNDGLILGVGCRLLPWFKISTGTLVYNRLNPDPLVTTGARTHFGLFASASFDLDVKGIFSSIPLISQIVLK